MCEDKMHAKFVPALALHLQVACNDTSADAILKQA